MPHCVIEQSSDINPSSLIEQVFQASMESSLFGSTGDDIKVRTVAFENYRVGIGAKGFVHVEVKILSGRSKVQKQALAQHVLCRLQELSLSDCCITVEITDMDRDSYNKAVV